MPRFRDKPSHFEVELEHEDEPLTVKVRWTPEADDEFARLYRDNGQGRLSMDEGEAYNLLLRQAVDWTGVCNEEGEPLPYSPDSLRSLFPTALKIRLVQRFISAVFTYTEAAATNPPSTKSPSPPT